VNPKGIHPERTREGRVFVQMAMGCNV